MPVNGSSSRITRQLADLATTQFLHADAGHRLIDRRAIGRRRAAQEAHVAVAAHHHHVLDQHREGPVDLLGLRHISHQVLPEGLPDRPPEQPDFAPGGRHEAHDGLEQGRLAGTVHADERGDRAARDLEAGVVKRRVTVAEGHGQVAGKDTAAGIVPVILRPGPLTGVGLAGSVEHRAIHVVSVGAGIRRARTRAFAAAAGTPARERLQFMPAASPFATVSDVTRSKSR
jgi:hypothetical protein